MIGQRLLHYEILEKLGEGGMGVVYRAKDSHLDRWVAIKVLPPDLVADESRKARFIQEAKSASALRHPNIIHIYDITSEAGLYFIAMEYVGGKTLDQLISSQGMPVKEALRVAVQIADAVASAHSAGIIHRDLKPANVMVDEHGRVKVIDFGLAKLREQGISEDASTATIGVMTEEGSIVGTAAYMSPEQASGRPVDVRSDIFSFGTVLYEMITGRRAFEGNSKVSTLAAVLGKEPAQLSATIPQDLTKLITRCLRKDPERRFQHMDDVKVALMELKEESETGGLPAESPSVKGPASRRPLITAVSTAGVLVLAAAAGIGLWLSRPSPAARGIVLTRLTADAGMTAYPALSPDGKLLAYTSDRSGEGHLDIWVKQIAGGEPVRLTNDPADDSEPVFSPDGSKIAFRSERGGGGIYIVYTIGGEERLIAPGGRQPSFSPDGSQIAYYAGNPVSGTPLMKGAARIFVMNSTGGPARQMAADFDVAVSPVWSEDGKHVVFAGRRGEGDLPAQSPYDFWAASVDGGPPVNTGVRAVLSGQKLSLLSAYSPLCPSGGNRFVLALRSGDSVNLWQIALSPKTWQVQGQAQRLTSGTTLEILPSVASGRLAFTSMTASSNVWMLSAETNLGKATGAIEQVTRGVVTDQNPVTARNDEKLVYISNRSGRGQVWVKDLETGKETAVTSSQNQLHRAIISPDGSAVAYRELSGRDWRTFIVPSTGGVAKTVCEDCAMLYDWAADGGRILCGREENRTIAMLDPVSGTKRDIVRHATNLLWQGGFSPDGRWVSFLERIDPSRRRLYIVPFREGPPVPMQEWIPVTTGQSDDDHPRWSPDGNTMYFTSLRDQFRCIWAQPLDPATKRPRGSPAAVYHSHSANRSLMNLAAYPLDLSVTRKSLIFNLGEKSGNIWMATMPE